MRPGKRCLCVRSTEKAKIVPPGGEFVPGVFDYEPPKDNKTIASASAAGSENQKQNNIISGDRVYFSLKK